MKKKYVSVSARIPEDVFNKLQDVRDKLELTTNQIVSNSIEDWVDLCFMNEPKLTHRLEVARFSLLQLKKQNQKL